MKLGFITNCFAWAGQNDLLEMARWAAANGFSELEAGPSIPLEESLFDRIRNETGVGVSTFLYCRNFLDPVDGPAHVRQLKDRIALARKIGADKVICSTGISSKAVVDGNVLKYDPEACLDEIAEVFLPILEFAEKQGIKIGFENCPMMFNAAISPYMWERLYERLDSPLAGMVFDPSHLVWQMIDPLPLIRSFRNRIFHVHGKDCEILWDVLRKMGILHTVHRFAEPVDNGEGTKEYDNTWFRYRLPGFGDLDWRKLISELQIIGYQGSISIEHEDPVWCGALEKIQTGLLKSRDYFRQYL